METVALIRTSDSIRADIGALQSRITEQTRTVQDLEAKAGADYRSLLRSGTSDSAALQEIATAQSQLNVLQRSLDAARADLQVAEASEEAERRHAARSAITGHLANCRKTAAAIQEHIDSLGGLLTELHGQHLGVIDHLVSCARDLEMPYRNLVSNDVRTLLRDNAEIQDRMLRAMRGTCEFIRPAHFQPGAVPKFDAVYGSFYQRCEAELAERLDTTGAALTGD